MAKNAKKQKEKHGYFCDKFYDDLTNLKNVKVYFPTINNASYEEFKKHMKNCLSPFDDLKTKLIKGEFVLNTLYDEITSYTLYDDLNLNDSNKIFVILRRKNGKDIVIAYNKKITLIHTTMSITH